MTKVTLEVFKAKLKKNEYAGSTGALRALGRVGGMSKKDKVEARAAVARKFKTAKK